MKCNECGKRIIGHRSRKSAMGVSSVRLCGSCYEKFESACWEGDVLATFGIPRTEALTVLYLMKSQA
jgi:hypothetical protein